MEEQFIILNRVLNVGEIIKIDDEETFYRVICKNPYNCNWLALLDLSEDKSNDDISKLCFFYIEGHAIHVLTTPVKEELKHPTNKHTTVRYMIFNMGSPKEEIIK